MVSGSRASWRRLLLGAAGLALATAAAMGASATAPLDEAPLDETGALEPLPTPRPIVKPTAAAPEAPASDAETSTATEPELPAAEDPWAGKPRWIRHRVVPRESPSQIALRYGVSLSDLRSWNELSTEAVIQPRDRLRIYARRFPPQREKREHTVGLGDTWGGVARAYGVSPSDLRAYNVRRTGRRLDEGEVLHLWVDPPIYAHLEGHTAAPGPEEEIYPGGHGVGTPNEGRLVNAAIIPPSDEYELRFPNSSWGTSHAVAQAVAAMRAFRERSGYRGTIALGTMSRERGGEVGGHNSHQSGRDLDIRLPVRDGVPPGLPPKARTIDWEATWHLVNAFADTGEVTVIFLDYRRQKYLHRTAQRLGVGEQEIDRVLQYPIGRAASRGIVRHSPGHDAHIHVRFACGDYETECAD